MNLFAVPSFSPSGDSRNRFHQWLSVIALLLLVTGWRFYQVRYLTLPAWVDSVHHTLLVRILLEQGTVPETWGPYLPTTPFYYHFGFHLSAALLTKVTGMTGLALGNAVLIAGQLWQVLLVLALYLLARTLFAAHEPAFIAALLVSFVAEMPAFYVSWGRYPLLAGATLLIGAMTAATARRWWLLTLLTALTAITHHYTLFLLALFLLASWLLRPAARRPLFLSGLAAALLVSPWLWRVWRLGQQWAGVATQQGDDSTPNTYLLTLLGPLHNYGLLLIALIGFGLLLRTLYQKPDAVRPWWPFALWTFLLLLLLGPWALPPFRADHAALLIFLPAVLFATLALTQLPTPMYRWSAVLLLLLWGMMATRNLVRPDTILADAGDVAALQWIDTHTAPDTKFLIDVAPWFTVWRGVDGGWWITPLTGRATVLPPLAYLWGEADEIAGYRAAATKLSAIATMPLPLYCDQLMALMAEQAATLYYTHSLSPRYCPQLMLVYEEPTGVQIFQFAY
ncbi:MAG: hypothetical protein DYG89_10035 [Caldilinea sp. CFX5]|nr:hypothetical protein [Caldilinea sp. CFX5]